MYLIRFTQCILHNVEVNLKRNKDNLDFVDSTLFLEIRIHLRLHYSSKILHLAYASGLYLSSAACAIKAVRKITDIKMLVQFTLLFP